MQTQLYADAFARISTPKKGFHFDLMQRILLFRLLARGGRQGQLN